MSTLLEGGSLNLNGKGVVKLKVTASETDTVFQTPFFPPLTIKGGSGSIQIELEVDFDNLNVQFDEIEENDDIKANVDVEINITSASASAEPGNTEKQEEQQS